MELEEKLRDEYRIQLDEKTVEIERLRQVESSFQKDVADHKATIEKQIATIAELSANTAVSERAEQLNRELDNRSQKQAEEIAELKKRIKALQKDLAALREEHKTLTQFDPARMKKNLDASKKKLADKAKAADLLQKSLNQQKRDNASLERQVKELEARLAGEELQGSTAEADAA
jgi:chromosome segregation ATPase